MTDKVYDFLPAHLKNDELENIFNATIDRVFSKGQVEKVRSFVGRKEKGIYKRTNSYLEYPFSDLARKNYSLEPVYSNVNIRQNVFYDDLINLVYNKGGLVNDHRRIFTNTYNTINLPIDSDKFCNWAMYYWVYPGLDISITGSNNLHYVTVDRGTSSWWSQNNSWYHFEDIKHLLTADNKPLIKQAKRPIIEFDNRLVLSDLSASKNVSDLNFEEPTFKVYNSSNSVIGNEKVFSYVTGTSAEYPYDNELMLFPKMIAGDYYSEYVFVISLDTQYHCLLGSDKLNIYTKSNFNFRNVRQEKPEGIVSYISLAYEPMSENDIDVYVDGIKQVGNYQYLAGEITLDVPTDGYVYVDYATLNPIQDEVPSTFQLINPSVEYNPDNINHVQVEFTYSTIFEHLIRIIETTPNLEGQAISDNNFRLLTGPNKTLFNDQGSVMIKSGVDISFAYFALSRDDYDPYAAVEFLSSSYSGYKNKLVLTIKDILKSVDQGNKTNTEILEEALQVIATNKSTAYKIFEGVGMLDYGIRNNHYEELPVANVNGSLEQFMPPFSNPVVSDADIAVYVNGNIQILGYDYHISSTGGEILFTSFVASPSDIILVRNYINREDLRIPPSAVKLGISAAYVPHYELDNQYSEPTQFIVGHDGSKTPRWYDRTDEILLEYEIRVYNNLADKTTSIDYLNYGVFVGSDDGYSNLEKNHIAYPFFKKWMIKNSISDMYNNTFDPNDWKTWNYNPLDQNLSGNWRGIYQYFYGTDNIFSEPWKILKVSQKPSNFDSIYGTNYHSPSFWAALIADAGVDSPVPVYTDGQIKTIDDLLYSGEITAQVIDTLDGDWKFGDLSPIELTWKHSSEYSFISFIEMMLQKPFDVLYMYEEKIKYLLELYSKSLGIKIEDVYAQKQNYEFKLGSKLAGFVNNFSLLSENESLVNSKYTPIPSDNYDLFVHASVPSKSENFSAITIEKVSLDALHPTYNINDTADYKIGEVVINPNDKKYYKRKTNGQTEKEIAQSISFDYSAWILVSQPNIKSIGYRIHGYVDLHPMFVTYDWDTASGEKVFETEGDKMVIKNWKQNTYYRINDHVVYNNIPYVCLEEHTSSNLFENSLNKWKAVGVWPRVNKIYAYGYNDILTTKLKTYYYGDILTSVNDVVRLMVGYQAYLEARGWKFVDILDNSSAIDFESLIPQFLEWSAQGNNAGEYLSLTPIRENGSFTSFSGVASVAKETFKNFYRVVDVNGNKISENDIEFYSTGNTLTWKSNTPVYGINIGIQNIEHAFVVDREDSYNDVIYDPAQHNRNLRMLVDCDRAVDWNGTMSVDGYIVYGNKMVPNFETIVNDVLYYRDTLVDQGLENINLLKASQIGFFPRDYFTRMGIERESQLEFYKGFIVGKGSKDSVNKLVNLESNITDIENSDVWAFKLAEYGNNNSRKTVSSVINISDMKKNPHVVTFDTSSHPMTTTLAQPSAAIKTSGYVSSEQVAHVVYNQSQLTNLAPTKLYEGDIAWIQFDDDREWDVRRLSEIAEIAYLGETPDAQLYIALTNEISTENAVFLKIISSSINPSIQGYYYPVYNSTQTYNGVDVYLYLIFDMNYEAVIVEIDTSTSNSIYVPTETIPYVEANGTVSNPVFSSGDTIVINSTPYSYNSSGIGTSTVQIYASEYSVNPFVQEGERIRLSVFDKNGLLINNNSTVLFSGTAIETYADVDSLVGDQITIQGVPLTVGPSSETSISIISDNNEFTEVAIGSTIVLDGNVAATFQPITVVGTATSLTLSSTKALNVNGTIITFTVPSGSITGSNTSESFNSVATPVNSIQLTTNMATYLPGNITVTNGVDAPYVLSTANYSYNSSTKIITFNVPIQDGKVIHTDTVSETLTADGIIDTFTLTGPYATATRIIVVGYIPVTDYNIIGDTIVFVSPPATDVTVTYETDSLVDQNGLVNISVELIAQATPIVLSIDEIVSTINASPAPVVASKTLSGALQITYSGAVLAMNGSILIDFGMSTTSSFRDTAYSHVVAQLNGVSNITSHINADKKIVIETLLGTLTVSGTAISTIGIDSGTYHAVAGPTRNSVVDQINNLGIANLTASVTPVGIKIYRNNHTLTITEITAGAMARLGFATTSISLNSADIIAQQINSQAFANDTSIGTASVLDSRIKIVSPQSSIVISDVDGNALSDIGIVAGTYLSTTAVSSTASAFKDQINAAATDVTVSISSDGRMIFTGNNNLITFMGTSQSILDKIGLYREYTSIASNTDFKVMQWKSVRYTPYVNGSSFTAFYSALGLNSTSYIWADDYTANGWAILYRSANGTLSVVQRQAPRVDVENINRLVVTDDQANHHLYSLFDPLNLKFAGETGKQLKYVTWQDPAQYQFDVTTDKWAADHVGEIWWDTTSARYYRYHDYGDINGNIDSNYVRKYWGKLVPNSEIKVYRWTASTTLPTDVTSYNEVVNADPFTDANVSTYYFWTSESIGQESGDVTPSDIKSMIENKTMVDNFYPISESSILVTNNKLKLKGERVRFDLDYYTDNTRHETHSDWHLVSEKDSTPIPNQLYQEMIDSVAGNIIVDSLTNSITTDEIDEIGNVVITGIDFLTSCDFKNSVVTINSKTVPTSYIQYDGHTLIINYAYTAIEGDVVRVYKLSSDYHNWFKNISEARRNFAYIVNEYMKRKFIDGFAHNWKEYVNTDGDMSVILLDYWALNSDYDTISRFEYLSKTTQFDMIGLYNSGIQSFKVSTDVDEYFFPVNGTLRMVNRTKSSLRLSYDTVVIPKINPEYYKNSISVQTIEFMNMMKIYADPAFLKSLFIEMTKYMLTEKTYPDFVFKTSYFDLMMKDNGLKQSAVYLRDYYQDMIDYVNDTKPYHAKIREVVTSYTTSESMNGKVTDYNGMALTLSFGGVDYFSIVVDEAFDDNPVIENIYGYFNPSSDDLTLNIFINGVKIRDQYYSIQNGNLVFETYGDILDGSEMPAVNIAVGDVIHVVKNISRYALNKVEGNATINTDNNYDGGNFLQAISTYTNFGGGIDTGFVSTKSRDVMVITQSDYTDETRTTQSAKKFYVYDQFGRGYVVEVENIGSISAFNGSTVTVNQQSYFKSAKGDTKRLSILDNGTDLEFFLYDKKDGTELRISDRGIYTGKMANFSNGDAIYSVKSVVEI